MGLFGKKFDAQKMLTGFQAAQATLAGDYGAAAGIWGNYADQKRKAKKDEAEAEAIAEARQAAFAWAKQQGMTDEAAATIAMDPSVAASAVRDRSNPQKFESGGGSLYDPVSKQFTVAPSERQVGRDIIRTDGEGNSKSVYSGIEPVVVPQGPRAGVYGWNNQGFANPPGTATQHQPPPSELPDELTPEEMEELERGLPSAGGRYTPGINPNAPQGGASQSGSRTFPGATGIFGRPPRFPF